ncbi:MAG: hypothetical protein Phog2KO_05230 [Phototrophicaceae bacterium]
MKKALLIVDIKTHFAEFMRLADALATQGEYEPIFCLAYSDYSYCCIPHPTDYEKFLAQCVEKGYEVANLEDSSTKESVIEYISKNRISNRVNDKYLFRYLEHKPRPLIKRLQAKTSGGFVNRMNAVFDKLVVKLSNASPLIQFSFGWLILLLAIPLKMMEFLFRLIAFLFSIIRMPFDALYDVLHPHYDRQYNALRNYVLALEENSGEISSSYSSASRHIINSSIRITRRSISRLINLPRILARIPRNFINRRYATFVKLMNVYSRFIYYGYYLDYIPKFLKEHDIDVIVLPEDNVSYGAPIWVKCANDLKIPSVIMPYTIANATEAATVLSADPQYVANEGNSINWLISKKYPKWTYKYEDKILLRRPGVDVWMMEYYGVSTPNPWLFYSTHAQALFIENQAMKKYHIDSGVAEDNMIITGAAYDDTLANYLHNKDEFRAELFRELGLSPNKPLLLVALPPRIQPDKLPNVDDFDDFVEIVEFWMSNCGNIEDWNVVVSLHPSLSFDDYLFIEDWGVKISRRDISQLIPMADVYLACVSATIRLAVACGIPVINYDVFRFRYQDYVGIEGVFAVEERDDFLAKLQDLTSNEVSLKQAQLMIKPFSAQWGMLDGMSTKRIVETFDRLREEMKSTA